MNSPFKVCGHCGHIWPSRDAFLNDLEVVLIGYQADFEHLEKGLLLFNHSRVGCGTTLAVEVAAFADLVPRPMLAQRLTGTQECPGFCLRVHSLEPCPLYCECAFVRDLLQRLRAERAKTG